MRITKLVVAGLLSLSATFSAGAQSIPQGTDAAALYQAAKTKEGGRVVWYLNQPLEPLRLVANEFEKQYPGMHVELERGIGFQLMQKFVQEFDAKKTIADVIQISDPIMMRELAEKNYLAHWKVPTFDRIPEDFRIGDQAYTIIITDMAILYNPNKLSDEEVKLLNSDWNAVLDPRFKGRFSVVTKKCGICYAGVSLFLDPKLKDRFGRDFLVKVTKQKPAIYSDSVVAMDRVLAGEQDFLFWFAEGPAVTKWKQGAPMRWAEPSPRPAYANAIQGVITNSPHPNGARLFQDWLHGDAGAKALQEKYGVRIALKGVADTRPVAKESWFPRPQDYKVDLKRWAERYDKDQDFWIKAIRKNR